MKEEWTSAIGEWQSGEGAGIPFQGSRVQNHGVALQFNIVSRQGQKNQYQEFLEIYSA